jgi:hypothetical protein
MMRLCLVCYPANALHMLQILLTSFVGPVPPSGKRLIVESSSQDEGEDEDDNMGDDIGMPLVPTANEILLVS